MSESEIVSVARWEKLRKESGGDAPRFAVRHLFLLLTLSAVHMAMLRGLVTDRPGIGAAGVFVAQSFLLGFAYTGGIELVIRACRGARWRVEPGHWLLAAIGVAAFVQILAEMANQSLGRQLFATLGIYVSVLGLTLLAPLLARDTPRVWRIFIGLQMVMLLQSFALAAQPIETTWSDALSQFVTSYEPLATFLLIAFTAWMDPERNARRWLHWAGVAVWILSRSAPALCAWL